MTCRSWGDPDTADAGVLLVHGLGAHCGWYEGFAPRLTKNGLFALSYDQVGFGKRAGQEFSGRRQWREDLVDAFDQLKTLVPGRPLILVGNSMGAVVAADAAEQLKPSGVVFLSPGFDGHPQTFSPQYKLKALALALVAPSQQIELPYTEKEITSSPEARSFITADPLKRFTLDARMGLELLKLTLHVRAKRRSLPCPLFMATAGLDRIVDNNVSQSYYERLNCLAKRKIRFENSFHDLVFEPVADDLIKEIMRWWHEEGRRR